MPFVSGHKKDVQFRLMKKGFTLVELIIVVAILAIVAATVFVALDPAKQFHAARNSTRWADVTTIMEGIKRYEFDNDQYISGIDEDETTVQIIGSNIGPCSSANCAGYQVPSVDCALSTLQTDLRPYMKDVPQDPKTGTDRNTRYFVNQDEYGLISVGACDSEGEEKGGSGIPPTIEVTR